jgi:hypothetical protein
MDVRLARGGAKPRMLEQGGIELFIDVGRDRKFGMYELSRERSVLARRVELPAWVYEDWQASGITSLLEFSSQARYPQQEIEESRGHIFWRPPQDLLDGPAVGIDVEIWNEHLVTTPSIRLVRFYVYKHDYELVAIWRIGVTKFVDHSVLVKTKPQFAPQKMVELSMLTDETKRNYLH